MQYRTDRYGNKLSVLGFGSGNYKDNKMEIGYLPSRASSSLRSMSNS